MKTPILAEIETLILEIKELEETWECLDSQGTGIREQVRIGDMIFKLESTIKFLKNVLDYKKDTHKSD